MQIEAGMGAILDKRGKRKKLSDLSGYLLK